MDIKALQPIYIKLLMAAFLIFWHGHAWTSEDPDDNQGCTPGYWGQPHHFDSWPEQWAPGQPFSEVFKDAFPGMTLIEVLRQGGGGLKALGRHTVAALLNVNTALPETDSEFMSAWVKNMFNEVFPADNDSGYEELKDFFDSFNEQHCPRGVFVWQFDFGTESSPLEPGFIRATPSTRYAADIGYGWRVGDILEAVDRQVDDALDRDANLSQNASFRLDVPNGLYTVTVRFGDTVDHDPYYVIVKNQLIADDDVRPAGVIETRAIDVRVTDGYVDVVIQASGSLDEYPDPDARINALTMQRLLLPPDPTRWEISSSNVLYRHATEKETVENGWPINTYLVINDERLLNFSNPEINAFVPLSEDADVIDTVVPFVGLENEIPVVELGFAGYPSSERQVGFLRYELRDPDHDSEILFLADPADAGGFWGRVRTSATNPLSTYEIRNGEGTWYIDIIALPDGSLPNPAGLYAILPGQASGPSDLTSNPSPNDFGFALIGEIKWCTANRTGWPAALAGRALHIREGFQACPEGDCTKSTGVNMIQKGLYCNITYSQEVADACALGDFEMCPPNESVISYAFLGCGSRADCYLGCLDNSDCDRTLIEENLRQAQLEGYHVNQLDIVQVVHKGKPGVQSNPETTAFVCGKASFPSGLDADGLEPPVGRGGTSVVAAGDGCLLKSSPHEIGHNFGGIHERSNPNYAGGTSIVDCTSTIMEQGTEGTWCNVFSKPNAKTLEDCAKSDELFLDFSGIQPYTMNVQVQTKDCPILGDKPLFPPP